MNERSLFGNLVDIYFAPREAYEKIVARPAIWAALVGLIVLHLAFTAVWMQKVDAREFMRGQMEESGAMDRIPPDRLGEIIDQQARMFPIFAWLAPLFIVIATLLLALVFLLIFKLFYSASVTFTQSWAVVLWTSVATSLVTLPLILLVLALKGEWSIDPNNALMANAAALLEKGSVPKPLYVLASALDLISFWTMFLLSTGYAAATRRPLGSAAAGVVGAWVLYVLIKVGWAAIF